MAEGLGAAQAPGTCGELAQGTLDGCYFHITCPIDWYATASVCLVPGRGGAQGPADCPKAVRALRLALAQAGAMENSAALAIESPLPRGRGMASSTADVAGAIAATSAALGRPIDPDEIARLALMVEPSDGLMFPGIALFDHREGKLRETLGSPPPLSILVLDPGGTVDTLVFNSRDLRPVMRRHEAVWREAIGLIREGVFAGDPALIGQGATLDSLTWAKVLPQPLLPQALALAKETGALGVNIAHSGTVLGLLYPPGQERLTRAAEKAKQRLPSLEGAYSAALVSGGLRLLPAEPPSRQPAVSQKSARAQRPVG